MKTAMLVILLASGEHHITGPMDIDQCFKQAAHWSSHAAAVAATRELTPSEVRWADCVPGDRK